MLDMSAASQNLIEEYQALALKELKTPLSLQEKARLQELIVQISAIDTANPCTEEMKLELSRLDALLEQMRLQAETLINTNSQVADAVLKK